jgi:outer membrane lipoprotein-sorting protein
MKDILNLPAFTANRCRLTISLGFVLFLIASQSGCIFKPNTKITPTVSQAILNAKTASFEELLNLIASYNKINELSSGSLKLTLERKISGEKWERWKSAPGYILLKRPDSVRLALRSPLGTEFEMVSVGDDLSAWIPSKHRFYIGKNSAKELSSEGVSVTMRGPHIFNAIIPNIFEPNSPQLRISMEEEKDARFKYYIISFLKDDGSRRIHAFRRIWIERSKLVICRQQLYLEDGQVESDVQYEYSDTEKKEGLSLPHKIHVDRSLDGYTLTMEFNSESWRINSGLEDKAFVLPTPPGAEIIHLGEKTRNGAS